MTSNAAHQYAIRMIGALCPQTKSPARTFVTSKMPHVAAPRSHAANTEQTTKPTNFMRGLTFELTRGRRLAKPAIAGQVQRRVRQHAFPPGVTVSVTGAT